MIAMTRLSVRCLLLGLLGLALFGLSACNGGLSGIVGDTNAKAKVPIPKAMVRLMKAKGMKASDPIMLRIYKNEDVLEVWKPSWKGKDKGRYRKLAAFEICKWSGKLGPKFKEGDKQAPEGFYHVNKWQMNPNSAYHLSFNLGYPNAFDRAHGRTGAHLMVHGACSSAGCYSMTDERVAVIYALAREAFAGGQKKFQVQAYPFRMTPKNMAKHRNSKHFDFWTMLKRGSDFFELTGQPPKVDVCGKRYVFNSVATGRYIGSAPCPALGIPEELAVAFAKRQDRDLKAFSRRLSGEERATLAPMTPITPQKAFPGFSIIKPAKVDAESKEPAPKAADSGKAGGTDAKKVPDAPTVESKSSDAEPAAGKAG